MKFTNKTKLLALLMALMLMITAVFVGCGSEDKKDDDKKDETTVAEEKTTKADKDEDKNEDENDKTSIKGFTLKELEAALNEYAKNQDLDQLKSYILPESDAILEYMFENDSSVDNEEFEEEFGYDDTLTEIFGYSELSYTSAQPDEIDSVEIFFPNDGRTFLVDGDLEYIDDDYLEEFLEEYGSEAKKYENGFDYFVETYAPDYYDVAAEAVAKAYKDSNKSVEFVDLSFVSVYAYEFNDDYNVCVGSFDIFIIETNTGWFFLTETL